MSRRRWILLVAVLVVASVGWAWHLRSRTHRPSSPTPISSIVKVTEWRINGRSPTGSIPVLLEAGTDIQCTGAFEADPKQWSNVAKTQKRLAKKPEERGKLNLVLQFVAADGDGTKIELHRQLNFHKSDRGECTFDGKVRVPAKLGEYEFQMAIGVSPADAFRWDDPPIEWHIVAGCNVDVQGNE